MIGVTDSERRAIEEVLSGRNPASETTYSLQIGGESYTERAGEIEISGEEDAPGLVLEADIAGELPRSVENETVVLEVEIAGVSVTRFRGTALEPEGGEVFSTLRAGTGGFFMPRIQALRKEYVGAAPSQILYEAMAAAPYLHAEVDAPDSPPIYRTGEEAFGALDKLADMVEAVEDETNTTLYDRPDGTAKLFASATLSRTPGEIAWEVTTGSDLKREDFTPKREGEAYAEVAVYRALDSGIEILARADVPGSHAPVGAVKMVELSDQDTTGAATERAYQRAYDEAAREAWGGYSGELPILYLPVLLERGDLLSVTHDEVGGGSGRWLALAKSYKERYPRKRMTIQVELVVARSER